MNKEKFIIKPIDDIPENHSSENNPQDEPENKFGTFVDERRKFYGDFDGANTLDYISRDREYANEDAEGLSQSIEALEIKIDTIRSEVEERKNKILDMIFKFREIRDLKNELKYKERTLESQKDQFNKKAELVEAYDYLLSKEEELAGAMIEAYEEDYEWEENKRLELIREEDGRDLSKLAEKHEVFFVHDIFHDSEARPSANNRVIDTKNLDVNAQLDILLGLEPTISASTLHEGSKQKTYADNGFLGVLLSQGRILGGDNVDAGTVAVGLKERLFTRESDTAVESIDNAIRRKSFADDIRDPVDATGYNELIIENPEVAGVYIKWDEDLPDLVENQDIVLSKMIGYKKDHEAYGRWWKQVSDVMDRGLPLFILDKNNNKVRLMYDIDIKNKSIKVTPEYGPKDINNMPGIYKQHLGQEEKRKAVMRVFDKVVNLIPEDDRDKFLPDGTEKDVDGMYDVH